MLKHTYLVVIFTVFPIFAYSQTSVIYVDRDAVGSANGLSWTNAFTRLTDAFNAANANPDTTEIRVMAGRYVPTDAIGAPSVPLRVITPIRLIGGFQQNGIERFSTGRTVISGDIRGDDANPNPFEPADNADRALLVTNSFFRGSNIDFRDFLTTNTVPLIKASSSDIVLENSTIQHTCSFHGCVVRTEGGNGQFINVSVNRPNDQYPFEVINTNASFTKLPSPFGIRADNSKLTVSESNWTLAPGSSTSITGGGISSLKWVKMSVQGDSANAIADINNRKVDNFRISSFNPTLVDSSSFSNLSTSNIISTNSSLHISNSIFTNIVASDRFSVNDFGRAFDITRSNKSDIYVFDNVKANNIDGTWGFIWIRTGCTNCYDASKDTLIIINSDLTRSNIFSTYEQVHQHIDNTTFTESRLSGSGIVLFSKFVNSRLGGYHNIFNSRIDGGTSISANLLSNSTIVGSLTSSNSSNPALYINHIENSVIDSVFLNNAILLSSTSIIDSKINGAFKEVQLRSGGNITNSTIRNSTLSLTDTLRIANSILAESMTLSNPENKPAGFTYSAIHNSFNGSYSDAGNNIRFGGLTPPDSLLIDRGSNSIRSRFTTNIKDLIGNVRIWDGNGDGVATVDIGPIEFYAPLVVEPPTAPSQLSPMVQATGISVDPVLRWRHGIGAERYRLQLALDSGFNTTLVDTLVFTDSLSVRHLNHNQQHNWRVRSENSAGESAWVTASFTTIIEAPGSVSWVNPNSADLLVDASFTIRWNPAPRASRYRLELAPDSTFSNPLNQVWVTGTDTILSLNTGVRYHLRIRAENAGGTSTWSTTHIRTKYPELTWSAPADSSITERQVVVSWSQGVSGNHTFEASTSTDFSTLIRRVITDSNSVDLSGLEYGTQYHLRVRDGNDMWYGDWSHVMIRVKDEPYPIPATPLLRSPETDARNVSVDGWLMWSLATDAASYEVQVSTDTTFTRLVTGHTPHFRTMEPVAAFAYEALAHDQIHYWRVRGVNPGETGAWSEIRHFRTVADSLSRPVLSSPTSSQESVNVTPTFRWEPVVGAMRYELSVSPVSDFRVETRVKDLTASTYESLELRDSTRYHWRVRAFGDVVSSSWSLVSSFKTELRVPDAPIWNPAQGDTTVSNSVVLEWPESARAEHYQVRWSTISDFSDAKITALLENRRYQIDELTPSTSYHWAVRASNESGFSPWSVTRIFRTLTGTSIETETDIPTRVTLHPPYPNPFNPSTQIGFELPESSVVSLSVYNSTGALVATLINGSKPSGTHVVRFDASKLASGLYWIELRTGSERLVQGMTLVK
jgi:hypothetical protein